MENNRNRNEEINSGMQLAASLPDIMPDQADEQIKPVYADIKNTLRVPIVNLIFRTLANYPDYFVNIWQQLSPSLCTEAFEKAADSLRSEALLKPVPEASKEDWEELDDLDRLRAFNDTIHYVLPKLLIVTTAFEVATLNSGAEGNSKSSEQTNSRTLPAGVAEGTAKVEMVDPDKASEQVQKLFESIKERHGHPLVSSYFRGLGNWPDFLEQAWSRLSPVVGSSAYEARKDKLIAQAEAIVQNMAVQEVQVKRLNEEQKSEVRAILAAFRLKFIPEMLLDAAFIKAMLDGAEEASSSRFSAVVA